MLMSLITLICAMNHSEVAASSPPFRAHVKRGRTATRDRSTDPIRHLMLPMNEWPTSVVAIITDEDRICSRIMSELARNGCPCFMIGDRGFYINVRQTDVSRAVDIARRDAKKIGYGFWVVGASSK